MEKRPETLSLDRLLDGQAYGIILKHQEEVIMKRIAFVACILCIVLATLVCKKPADANEFHFPLGLAYVTGFSDFVDEIERSSGADASVMIPVGLVFNPYYEFDFGFRIGAGIGPTMMVFGDVETFNIPLNFNVGYSFRPSSSVNPYVRGGLMYNAAFGDFIEGSQPGGFVAGGIEFYKTRPVGFGLELAYTFESAKIELESGKEIDPIEFAISIFARF